MVGEQGWGPNSAGIPAILAATASLHHSGHRAHHHREGIAGLAAGLELSRDHPLGSRRGLAGSSGLGPALGQPMAGAANRWHRPGAGGHPGGGGEMVQGNAGFESWRSWQIQSRNENPAVMRYKRARIAGSGC